MNELKLNQDQQRDKKPDSELEQKKSQSTLSEDVLRLGDLREKLKSIYTEKETNSVDPTSNYEAPRESSTTPVEPEEETSEASTREFGNDSVEEQTQNQPNLFNRVWGKIKDGVRFLTTDINSKLVPVELNSKLKRFNIDKTLIDMVRSTGLPIQELGNLTDDKKFLERIHILDGNVDFVEPKSTLEWLQKQMMELIQGGVIDALSNAVSLITDQIKILHTLRHGGVMAYRYELYGENLFIDKVIDFMNATEKRKYEEVMDVKKISDEVILNIAGYKRGDGDSPYPKQNGLLLTEKNLKIKLRDRSNDLRAWIELIGQKDENELKKLLDSMIELHMLTGFKHSEKINPDFYNRLMFCLLCHFHQKDQNNSIEDIYNTILEENFKKYDGKSRQLAGELVTFKLLKSATGTLLASTALLGIPFGIPLAIPFLFNRKIPE